MNTIASNVATGTGFDRRSALGLRSRVDQVGGDIVCRVRDPEGRALRTRPGRTGLVVWADGAAENFRSPRE